LIKLGLTGSIGMGKSTIAGMFKALGVPVWDADEAVHRLYASSQPVKDALASAFGDVMTEGTVDRTKLSHALKTAPNGFERLNAIVHPAVVEDRQVFMAAHQTDTLVVADIPLLYETGAEAYLDYVLVVSAPAAVQRTRVLARPGMTEDKFAVILSRQVSDADKRARADFVIDTSQSLDACRAEVAVLVARFAA
jgi:dephospho-CoA kinase